MSSIKYRPEIDGLRAVAVIPVILFHLGMSWMCGGFIGVDVFFVISGFLITSIILREQAGGTFSFGNFWMRRIKRILPVMLTVLAVTLVAGWFILYGPQWDSLGQQAMSVIFLCANIFMWRMTGDYWGPAAEEAPLLHCWSLSVEEQFYLFHPLILILVLKYRKHWVIPVFASLAVASFTACLIGTTRSPSATFYFLPTRAWELAAGCLVAAVMFKENATQRNFVRHSNALAAIGFALVLVGYFVVSESGFPGMQALLPVVGTCMIILYAGQQSDFVTRCLSHPVVVYIGKISYSLYLWHWPVIVFGKNLSARSDSILIPLGVYLLIPLLSVCSYHLVEQPTRRAKSVVPGVIAGTAVCIGFALMLMWMPWQYDFSAFQPTESYGKRFDLAPKVSTESSLPGVTSAATRSPEQGTWYSGDGWRNQSGKTPELVMFGSSHGLMWSNVIAACCNEADVSVAIFNVRAIPPLIYIPPDPTGSSIFTAEEKKKFDENRLAKLKLWRPKALLVSDRWSARDNLTNYQGLLKFCREIDCKVVFLGQPPEIEIVGGSAPAFVAQRMKLTNSDSTTVDQQRSSESTIALNQLIELGDSHDGCAVLEVRDIYMADSDKVRLVAGGHVLYLDDNHLSEAGARLAKERIQGWLETTYRDIKKH